MQVFLPYGSDFVSSAQALDNKRLNKQLLECRQILAALAGETKGWVNHPATVQFKYHEDWLFEYAMACTNEMIDRDIAYQNNFDAIVTLFNKFRVYGSTSFPAFLNDSRLEYTHRANLYLKDPEHYAQWASYATDYQQHTCCKNSKKPCQYWWASHEERNNND